MGNLCSSFPCKTNGVFNLHASDYDLANKSSSDEIIKNQREFLQSSFPQHWHDENSEETTKGTTLMLEPLIYTLVGFALASAFWFILKLKAQT